MIDLLGFGVDWGNGLICQIQRAQCPISFTRSKLIHYNITFARHKVKTDILQIGGNSAIHKLADQSSLLHNNSGHQHCCCRWKEDKKTTKEKANERRQNKAKHPAFPLNCVMLATKNFSFHTSKIFLDIVPAIYRIPDKGCCSMKMNFSTNMFPFHFCQNFSSFYNL